MELKHIFSKALFQLHQLLIVPYGIETQKPLQNKPCRILLIVPYGIETQ